MKPFKTIFASGHRYGQAVKGARQMAIMVKKFLEEGGTEVEIEVHCKELYELREENDKLRKRLGLTPGVYADLIFCDERI